MDSELRTHFLLLSLYHLTTAQDSSKGARKMTIKELSSKLRKAADVLDELVGVNLSVSTRNETKETAKKILKKVKRIPWQHKPENKAKVAKWLKTTAKAKAAKKAKKQKKQ